MHKISDGQAGQQHLQDMIRPQRFFASRRQAACPHACPPSWHDYIELMKSYKLFESFGSPPIRKPLAKTSNLTESPQITDELILKAITKTLTESLGQLTVSTTTSTLTALTSKAKATTPSADTSPLTAACALCLAPGYAGSMTRYRGCRARLP